MYECLCSLYNFVESQLFSNQIDAETFFNRIYNGKRLDPLVVDLCGEMRIDTTLLMPK